MRKACNLSIYALLIMYVTYTVSSLEEDAFQRIFSNTSLSTEQITEMAKIYNEKMKAGTAKKSVMSFLDELDDVKAKNLKKIKNLFRGMWADELFLRKLSNESFENIKGMIDSNLKAKIETKRKEAAKKYSGDFAKAQLDAVRFAVQSVPETDKVKLQEELDRPLKEFNSTVKRNRLVKAIERFQVFEKNGTKTQ